MEMQAKIDSLNKRFRKVQKENKKLKQDKWSQFYITYFPQISSCVCI